MTRTWTHHQTVAPGASFSDDLRIIQASDSLVYIGPDNNGDFYTYDGTTLTSIGFETWANAQGGDWTAASSHGIAAAWFGSKLYILANKDAFNAEDASIVEYNPSGPSFTEVKDFGSFRYHVETPGVNYLDRYAGADDSRIVFKLEYVDPSTGDEGQLWESTDGSTWTQVTDFTIVYNAPHVVLGKDGELRRNVLVASAPTTTTARIYEYDGGWTDLSGADITNKILIGYGRGVSWFMELSGADWIVTKSSDWGVNTSTGTGTLGFTPSNRQWRMRDVDEATQLLGHRNSTTIFEYDPTTELMEPGQDLEYPGGTDRYPIDFFYLGTTVYLLSSGNLIWAGGELGFAELRLTGIEADDDALYLTGDEGEIVKLWTHDLRTLLYVRQVASGAVTYAELDARTHGFWPVVKPDKSLLFIFGRDGNDYQLQYSDDKGVSLTDISDAAWGSSKYAIGLFPDPINQDDMVICFSDDDIYQTIDGGDSFSKVDDAPVTLRTAARALIDETVLILAGQVAGAGELFFSPNLGDTTEDISDAGLALINYIRQSL